MPSTMTLIAMNAVHRVVIAATRGRFGWTVKGMPALELTTTGRTSGRRRSTMLTSPVQVGDALVVVASRGGDDHHPAWFLNLEADGDVQVALGGRPAAPMRARVASDAERRELWPAVTARYPGYAAYQRRTDRVIPLVLLEPVAGSTRP